MASTFEWMVMAPEIAREWEKNGAQLCPPWLVDRVPFVRGGTIQATLFYPRLESSKFPTRAVEIQLEDVRAADGIRVIYDFNRDGWSIAQASTFMWYEDDPPDDDWQEVAFVRAWGRMREEDPENGHYKTPRGLPSRYGLAAELREALALPMATDAELVDAVKKLVAM